jgi:acyl-coenzyme A synthetase/AMP-(fatty) acid ligase
MTDSFSALITRAAGSETSRSSRLVDPHHQCAYGDIPANLRAIQAHLSSLGVAAGDCLHVELHNSVAGALLLLALLDAGHGIVLSPAPNAAHPESTTPEFCAWTLSSRSEAAAALLQEPAAWLTARRNDSFRARSDVAAKGEGWLFLRSSGSLSVPKLVAHRPAGLIGNASNVQARLQLHAGHRIALPAPIFHMYGLGAGFLPALMGGATIDFLESANALTYLQRERAFDPNVTFLTPTFCDFLVRLRRQPRRYEFIVSAGDTLPTSVFDRMEELHGPILNLYGSTEMGSVSVVARDMPRETRRLTAGVPYSGVDYRIAEGAFDDEDRPGFGELQLRHPYGFQGYVSTDGGFLGAATAFEDGWFRSGDYATVNADGTIQLFGRRDLSVKRSGRLLPISDIEHRLREIAGIRQAAVAIGEESIRGRRLIAFCVPEEGASLSAPEIQRHYASRAPAYAVPDAFHVMQKLPTLPNGKVDRRGLTALARQMGDGAGANDQGQAHDG